MEKDLKTGNYLLTATMCFVIAHIAWALIRLGILSFGDVIYVKVLATEVVKELIFAGIIFGGCIFMKKRIKAEVPGKNGTLLAIVLLVVFELLRALCSSLASIIEMRMVINSDGVLVEELSHEVMGYQYITTQAFFLHIGMMLFWGAYFIYATAWQQDENAVLKRARNLLIAAAGLMVVFFGAVWFVIMCPDFVLALYRKEAALIPTELLIDFLAPRAIAYTVATLLLIAVMFRLGKTKKKVGAGMSVLFAAVVFFIRFILGNIVKNDIEEIMEGATEYVLDSGISFGDIIAVFSVADRAVAVLNYLFMAALYLCIAAYVSYAVVQSKENAEKESVSE